MGPPLLGGISAMPGETRPSPPRVSEPGEAGGGATMTILGILTQTMVRCGQQTERCKRYGTVDRNGGCKDLLPQLKKHHNTPPSIFPLHTRRGTVYT